MSIRYPFNSSKSRITEPQKRQELINKHILDYIQLHDQPLAAETIWLNVKTSGLQISYSSFSNTLRKLVDAGLIEKLSFGYNKYLYITIKQAII